MVHPLIRVDGEIEAHLLELLESMLEHGIGFDLAGFFDDGIVGGSLAVNPFGKTWVFRIAVGD